MWVLKVTAALLIAFAVSRNGEALDPNSPLILERFLMDTYKKGWPSPLLLGIQCAVRAWAWS